MEERSNKTIICSVLFLDIVEYAKKTVSGQISLKDRFNAYLSEAIGDVPAAERIILDTGDGAAINFLGDVEAALNAALRLRASLLAEDPYLEPQLLVRIGINLGPVRLVRDINGQPNIVGDGINVAQRIMGFADPSQILVSRSYYDAVSRLSPQYPGMFHYQGSRTDKHVREHEIYAIGYPGDHTTRRMPAKGMGSGLRRHYAAMLDRFKAAGRMLAPAVLLQKFRQASIVQRALYAAAGIVILLAGMLPFMNTNHPVVAPDAAPVPVSIPAVTASAVPASAVPASAVPVAAVPASVVPAVPVAGQPKMVRAPVKKPVMKKPKVKPVEKKAAPKTIETHAGVKPVESHPVAKVEAVKKAAPENDESQKEPRITVSCKENAKLFLDGVPKGEVGPNSVTLFAKPGKHRIIITHPSFKVYSVEVELAPGQSIRMQPKECN